MMSRYRRNGTPTGDRRVYVVMPGWGKVPPKVWEVSGCKEWEEVEPVIAVEAMTGTFGPDFDLSRAVAIMPGANLYGAILRDANLEGADLRDANLEGARLYSVDLRGACLYRTNLEGASLSYANLRGAALESANLRGAALESANLEGADLRGADLRDADLEGAKLEGAFRQPDDRPIRGMRVLNGRLVKV